MIQRDKSWDAVKGLGILLVVLGHSGCPAYLHDFIYLFHMGLFFYVSGKFLKINRGGWKTMLSRRFQGLYAPFLSWGILYIVLHNVFFTLGWYKDSYTWIEMGKQILEVLAFKDVTESLLGPVWFLKSLFLGSLFTFIICLINRKRLQMVIVIGFYMIGWSCGTHYWPYVMNREIGVVIAIYSGYLLKDWNPVVSIKKFVLISSVLVVAAFYVKIDVVGCLWGNIGCFPVLTFLGVVFIFNIIRFVQKVMPELFNALSYLGENSIYILILHFTAFHLFSSLLVSLGIGDRNSLSNITVLLGINHDWWFIPYTVVGVLLPLLYPLLKAKIKQTVHV